jgi:hypothetical protein
MCLSKELATMKQNKGERTMTKRWKLWLVTAAMLIVMLPWDGTSLAGPSGEALSGIDASLAQGDDVLISRAVGDQSFVAVAYNDDDDEYLVVWSDVRGGGSGWAVYGQFLAANGIPKGDNLIIRDEADHGLWYPDVGYDTVNQRYLVAWEDITEFDVEGIVLNSDGTPYSAAFNIAEGDFGDQRLFPAVASYAHPTQGTYAVAYQRGSSGDYNIYARLVSVTGGPSGAELPVSTQSGDQTDPDLAVDPATGHFLIVWEDGRGAVDGIYGCVLYGSGFLGTEFEVSVTSIPRANPAIAFSPDAGTAGEWLVVFERNVDGDVQVGGRRVTADEIPVVGPMNICDDEGDQGSPDATYNTNSNQYLVVWQDSRNGNMDIYGRRVDASGDTLGEPFAIRSAPGPQASPAVASSSAASGPAYLVVYDDSEDIDGQMVGADGTLEGHPFTISAPVDDQERPAVAYNPDSGHQNYLVVWQDRRAGNPDIWGQLVAQDSTLVDENLAICSDAAGQSAPDVAYSSDTNQYLVVWTDARASDLDIYGQRVNADGSLDGGNFAIANTGTTNRAQPQVVYNPVAGEYFVSYIFGSTDNAVRVRRVPASGAPTTAEIEVISGPGDRSYPDIDCRAQAGGGGGGCLVVWHEETGGVVDVLGQRINQVGDPLGGILDICTQPDDQWMPSVAYNPDADHYLVVWPDDRNSASQGRDIYGRRVGGAGVLKDEFPISTAAEDQAHAEVAFSSGLENWVVTWDDDRNAGTAPDLYGQRVSNSGELVDTTVGENDALFVYSGWQQRPAVAWGGSGATGLVTWEDGRNGESFDIYGLQLGSAGYRVYLPLVVRDS